MFRLFPVQPGGAGGFQQGEGADQIGFHEGRRSGDGAVHVALGGEMDEGVNLVFAQQAVHQPPVANIALDEDMPGGIGQIAQVVQRTGVGQQVEVDDADFGIGDQQMANEIAADETGAAGHQHVAGTMFHERWVQLRSVSNSAITGA